MAELPFKIPELSSSFVNDHNQEALAVWNAFHVRKPIRPPVGLGTSAQFFIFNQELNPDELGVNEFEVGFLIDFGKIRQQLGPEVTIHVGPNIMLLKDGTPQEVAQETKRILNSGVLEGGRFVLREGNNLAPFTPFANLDAMYQQARNIRY